MKKCLSFNLFFLGVIFFSMTAVGTRAQVPGVPAPVPINIDSVGLDESNDLPKWTDQNNNIYVGQDNMWRWDAVNGFIRVSGTSPTIPTIDIGLPGHDYANGEHAVISCMTFSPYYASLTGHLGTSHSP